jgi:hypothetical protein
MREDAIWPNNQAKTYQTTKRKLTKQPSENLPNNQIKTCQTTKLLLNSLFFS